MRKLIIYVIILSLLFISCSSTQEVTDNSKPTINENAKLVALTFDDGPDVTKTTRVLDVLEKYNVKASFFVIGQHLSNKTKPIIERALSCGCEINNHSWGYSSMDKLSAEQIQQNIEKTNKKIEEFTGKTPSFFRAPNLATSSTLFENVGLTFISGIVAMDWDGCNTTAEQRAQNVLSKMKDGSIVLLHDNQPDPHPTPEALEIIIPTLLEEGYEFVTVSELFERKGVTPDPYAKKAWTYVE